MRRIQVACESKPMTLIRFSELVRTHNEVAAAKLSQVAIERSNRGSRHIKPSFSVGKRLNLGRLSCRLLTDTFI